MDVILAEAWHDQVICRSQTASRQQAAEPGLGSGVFVAFPWAFKIKRLNIENPNTNSPGNIVNLYKNAIKKVHLSKMQGINILFYVPRINEEHFSSL